MIGKSTQLTEETMEIADIVASSPWIRKRRHFQHPDNVKKWCEIHHTTGHDLEECKTFLDHKKMSPPLAPVPQESHQGEHCRAHPGSSER
jgi:hypothetical protein